MSKHSELDIDRQNAERSRRGRTARARGNSFEREVAARLNGKRTGMYGGKNDVEAGYFVIQCKVGLSYPERLDKWLRELNPKADQLAVLVVGDSPGAGKRRRALAVIDFDDFVQHYGKEETSEL